MKPTCPPASGSAPDHPVRLTYVIGNMDRVLKRRLTETLAPHGVTLPQFTALSVLKARGDLSNAKLAERSLITPQAACEVIKVMVARGWVRRDTDPCHGRIVVLRLTPEGAARVSRCETSIAQLEGTMMRGIERTNADQLHALLRVVLLNLRALDPVTARADPAD